jgi:hypothetical protein
MECLTLSNPEILRKIIMNRKVLFSTFLGIFLLAAMGIVSAAATYGPVTTSTSYRNGSSGDKNDKAADLNNGMFFGLNDWVKIVKTNVPKEHDGDSISNTKGGTTLKVTFDDDDKLNEGTWSFTGTNPWTVYKKVVIVLKSGKTKPNPGLFWTAWLLADGTLGGNWKTSSKKDLSHMTAYGSKTVSNVPIPAAVWLFGSGLIGVFGLSRRKSISALKG